MGNVVSKPEVTFVIAGSGAPIANSVQKVLLVGQYVTAGAGVSDGAWLQNIPSDGTENDLFGRTSVLAKMVRAFKRLTDRVQVDVIAFADDGSGVPRVVESAWADAATADGTLKINSGSELLHTVEVAITSGDSAVTAIGKAVTAINADLNCPFTADANVSSLRWTADNDGTLANGLPVGITGSVPGLTIADPIETTAGSVDPTLTGALTVIGTTRYQGIVWPYDDTTVVTAHLDPLFNPTNEIRDGVAFTCQHKTFANHISDLAGAEYNSQSLVYLADEELAVSGSLYIGAAVSEAAYLKATMFAAIRAIRLTPDLAISQFVTTPAALDQFGGPALASLPYFNTIFPHLPVPAAGRGFTNSEITQLKDAGAGVLGVNPAGSAAIAGEIPTTYLTDGAGNDDVTFQLLNYVDTESGAREYMHTNTRARFAQSRLTQGTATAGRSIANEAVIEGYLLKLYNDLAGPGFVLVQDGPAAIRFFKDNITVTTDLATGTATITMKLPIVTQARVFNATVNIVFDIAA